MATNTNGTSKSASATEQPNTFMTTDVAPTKSSEGPQASGEMFAGWTGPNDKPEWDGPVWSSQYNRFEPHKEVTAEEAEEKAKNGLGEHNEDLHLHRCPCSEPSHHTSYVKDIQRRIEPMVQHLKDLEHQISKLAHHVVQNTEDLAHKESQRSGEFVRGEHFHKHADPIVETLAKLEGQVGELMKKMGQILMDGEREVVKDVKSLGEIDQGNKDDVGHLFRVRGDRFM